MCQVGDMNLSYESLTSSTTWQILRDLPVTDPDFFAELSKPWSHVPAPSLSAEDALHEDAEASDLDVGDDTCVPLEAVLDAMHGELTQESEGMFEEGLDGVVSRAKAEEALIEEVDGIVVDATSLVAQEGRGKRKRFQNKLYEQDALKYWDKE